MSPFRPLSLTKSELALLYFPGSLPATGTNRLMRWIHGCPALLHELESCGYRRSQKLLTSRQVAIIVAHLGEP